MKLKLSSLVYAALLLLVLVAAKSKKVKRVVFFGDSITEQGVKPGGYITRLTGMLATGSADTTYELVGAGIGGNKVYDLYLRIEEDVLAKNPDVVVIFVGINDVWHKSTAGTGTDANKFEKFYQAIIKKLQDKHISVIVCTPPVIGEKNDFSNQQDGDLNRYAQLIRNIAASHNIPVCDLRKGFLDYEKGNNPENKESGILTTDRVHLNDKGNQLVADLLLPLIRR